MALQELHFLAELLPLAYQRAAGEFATRVKPVQDDVQKICVAYKDTDCFYRESIGCEQGADGKARPADLLYRLEVARVAGKFTLCIGKYKAVSVRPGVPQREMLVACEPFDSTPLNIKLEALKTIDAFVGRYVAHVKEQRKSILPEGALDFPGVSAAEGA